MTLNLKKVIAMIKIQMKKITILSLEMKSLTNLETE